MFTIIFYLCNSSYNYYSIISEGDHSWVCSVLNNKSQKAKEQVARGCGQNMEVRSRRGRESSPDRVKSCVQQPRVKPIKRVQVVYYLTRNGQLEHPHYMEVTHLANQPLRLRDIMERLTVLRGKGMPSLYSWSCKRSYKNGYVWNDLAENDIIYASDGAEYVLKGSELVEGCSEKFQQLNVSNRPQMQEPNDHLHSIKHKSFISSNLSRNRAPPEAEKTTYEEQEFDEEDDDEEYEDEEKTSYTCSTTPHSRCSRGVSTDELEDQEQVPNKNPTESTHHNSPPPPPPPLTTSSLLSDKPNKTKNNSSSKRFEDGDPIATESAPNRNSVLLQLIACGNLAVAKAKNVPSMKQPANGMVKKSENLHKGVLYKSAVKVVEEDKDMISYMSENPRFGNLQAEEKEYFSGSIVESMSEGRVVAEPVLKKSNSYNEERGNKSGMGEASAPEEEKRDEKAMKGKCIPRKKSSSSKQTKK